MRIVGSAILCAVMCAVVAAALAPRRRAQSAAGAQSDPAATAPQKLNLPLTRFAYVDGLSLADGGVKLEKSREALADLRTFGQRLAVDIIDVEKLQGAVFIADDRIDLTDDFLAAWKAKPSRSAPLEVPSVSVPATAVAFIDSHAFAHPETGVNKLVAALRSLEAEFKPRKDEMAKLKEQLEAGSGDGKRLEGEIKRKQATGQADFDRRFRQVAGPVYEDIGNSLKPFCKRHGISLLFDTSRIKKTAALPPFDLPFPADTPDVSAAFVAAYNKGALLDNVLIP